MQKKANKSLKLNRHKAGSIFGAGEGNSSAFLAYGQTVMISLCCTCEIYLFSNPLCRVLFRRHNPKTNPTTKGRFYFWCGRRESLGINACGQPVTISLRYTCEIYLVSNPLCRVLFRRHMP